MAFSVVQNCRRRFVSGVHPKGRSMVVRHQSTITNDPVRAYPLDNGVRLAADVAPGHLASLSVVVNAGVSHEKSLNGVANLLQLASVRNQAAEARKIGATLTGNTTRETTTYNITCLPEDTAKAVEILGQIVSAPVQAESLEAVRKEVVGEKRALWDIVNQEVVMDYLYSAAYQQTPFQQTVGGEIADLKKVTLEDLNAFRAQQYTGSNLVVSATGAIETEKLTPLVESAFSGVPQSQSRFTASRVPFTGSFMHIRDETTKDVQIAIGFETFSHNHRHALTLGVLQELVGSWSNQSPAGTYASARLAEGFALQKLVDNYHTFSHSYKNTGLFGVYASTTEIDKVDDIVYHIFNEYQKLFTYISPEELFRAQNGLKNKILAAEATTALRSQVVGEQMLNLDRRVTVGEAFRRIEAITVKDVQDVIDHYFYDVDPVVVAHGELEEMPDYVVMRNWTYWNRW